MNTINLNENKVEDLKELYVKLIELKRFKLAERVQKVIKNKEETEDV